ncbi:MAG: rhomboid family intramembrane serine protease [Geminicoccaceae bacterium]|nr:rhomboid family intramembrane serine protease [Geminicoccaceae bacterium]MDW8340365.1 rhomboid family intramembrane serine protease [Geminicoccaceae bacterium]
MVPVRDAVATRHPPFVTWTVIALCVLVYLFEAGLPAKAFERFLFQHGLVPARFFGPLALRDPPSSWDYRVFFTHMFLHGGFLHLLMNMWTLLVFGPAIEDRLGIRRYIVFYLACGLFAGLAHALVNAHSTVPAVGASGAIAGVIGAYARMFPRARLVMMVPVFFVPFFVEVPALVFAAFWFLSQVVPGLLALGGPADVGGVAWWAHIGGFVAGWALAPFLRRPYRRYRRFYADEGVYGFLPDGRRSRGKAGIGPWG